MAEGFFCELLALLSRSPVEPIRLVRSHRAGRAPVVTSLVPDSTARFEERRAIPVRAGYGGGVR